jgi:hypothetical protein
MWISELDRNPYHHPPLTQLVLEPSGMEMNVFADTVTLLYLNKLKYYKLRDHYRNSTVFPRSE